MGVEYRFEDLDPTVVISTDEPEDFGFSGDHTARIYVENDRAVTTNAHRTTSKRIFLRNRKHPKSNKKTSRLNESAETSNLNKMNKRSASRFLI